MLNRLRETLIDRPMHQPYRFLERAVVPDCETLLDVGCGNRSPVRFFSRRLKRAVGVDNFQPYLDQSRAAGIHTETRRMDIREIGEHFVPGEFDAVVAYDLIEHLTKPDGFKLLDAMERIAGKKVIVLTPNGFVPQTAYDDNSLQEHLSGWEPDEFRALGYRLTGVGGWKHLKGERGIPRFRPIQFWGPLSLWTQPLFEGHPDHAFHLFAVKQIVAPRSS